MFTGIVQACVAVRQWEPRDGGGRLRVPAPSATFAPALGDSVAVSGVCLTVVGSVDPATGEPADGRPGADLLFDLSAETLARTWFAELAPDVPVNLEPAARFGDPVGGHLVQGHVDGRGRIVAVGPADAVGCTITFEVDAGLERYVVDKGSITLDGISLTVVAPRGRQFDVAVIPETLERTTLGQASAGRPINVEADSIGKWIDHLLGLRH